MDIWYNILVTCDDSPWTVAALVVLACMEPTSCHPSICSNDGAGDMAAVAVAPVAMVSAVHGKIQILGSLKNVMLCHSNVLPL